MRATCNRLLAAGAVVAVAAVTGAQTLVDSRRPIYAAAASGSWVAWEEYSGCYAVRVRNLATGRETRLGDASIGSDCEYVPAFAASRERALWVTQASGNEVYETVLTRAPGEQRPTVLEEFQGSAAGTGGEYLVGVAGDATLLVYAKMSRSLLDTCIDPGTPCFHFVVSGTVKRVVGRKAVAIPRVPPAVEVAVGGRRVAVVVAARRMPTDEPRQARRVEVRAGVTGALVAAVRPGGVVKRLALSRNVLALLARSRGRLLLERYRLPGGRRLGVTHVRGYADGLAVSGNRIVFRTGRVIRLVDARTGRARIVGLPRTTPSSVSIEGRRLVWVENGRGRGRVVALTL